MPTPAATETPASTITLAPVVVEGEPRIRDVDLAARLGFSIPVDIRKLIRRHEDDLGRLGVLATVAKTSTDAGGRPGTEFFLNRRQAIFVTTKSATPEATDITIEIIHRFDAYERGEAVPLTAQQTGGIVKQVVNAALLDIRRELHAALSGYDPSLTVTTEFRPMLTALVERGVGSKKRRALSQRCSSRCMRWLIQQNRGADIRLSRETGRLLYRTAALDEWLAAEGDTLIAEHRDRIAGQGIMRFAPPRLVRDIAPDA